MGVTNGRLLLEPLQHVGDNTVVARRDEDVDKGLAVQPGLLRHRKRVGAPLAASLLGELGGMFGGTLFVGPAGGPDLPPFAKLLLEVERRPDALELSVNHDGHIVCQCGGLVHRVRGEQDGPSGPSSSVLDHIPKLPTRNGVETRGRLVQQDHRRVARQCHGNRETAPHATRVGRADLVSKVCQPDFFQSLLDLMVQIGPGQAFEQAQETDVLGTSQAVKLDVKLRAHANLAPNVRARSRGHLSSSNGDRASGWREVSDHHVDGGRLSRPVGTQERQNRVGLDAERGVLDSRKPLLRAGHPFLPRLERFGQVRDNDPGYRVKLSARHTRLFRHHIRVLLALSARGRRRRRRVVVVDCGIGVIQVGIVGRVPSPERGRAHNPRDRGHAHDVGSNDIGVGGQKNVEHRVANQVPVEISQRVPVRVGRTVRPRKTCNSDAARDGGLEVGQALGEGDGRKEPDKERAHDRVAVNLDAVGVKVGDALSSQSKDDNKKLG